jgi:hypothetical protein
MRVLRIDVRTVVDDSECLINRNFLTLDDIDSLLIPIEYQEFVIIALGVRGQSGLKRGR